MPNVGNEQKKKGDGEKAHGKFRKHIEKKRASDKKQCKEERYKQMDKTLVLEKADLYEQVRKARLSVLGGKAF